MRSPLLGEQKEEARTHSGFLLSLCIIFLLFIFTSLDKAYLESPVGVELDEFDLLQTYMHIGSLPRMMRNTKPYRGAVDPLVPISDCEDKDIMKCQQICVNRMKAQSSEIASESTRCTRINTKGGQECWETSKMRCWKSLEPGSLVYDGRIDWILLRHWQGEWERGSKVDIQWMHIRSEEKEIDMFIFSWGRIRPVSEICTQFTTVSGIPQRLQSIPSHHGIVFAGHSEGSGWALCAHDFMREFGLPHQHRAIVTGSLMIDFDFMARIDERFRETTLFLMIGSKVENSLFPGENILADVKTLLKPQSGATLPQFGFACTSPDANAPIACLSPQPTLNIDEGIRSVNKIGQTANQLIADMHAYTYYRKCYLACFQIFEGNDFTPNVAPYTKEETPNLEAVPTRARSVNDLGEMQRKDAQTREAGSPKLNAVRQPQPPAPSSSIDMRRPATMTDLARLSSNSPPSESGSPAVGRLSRPLSFNELVGLNASPEVRSPIVSAILGRSESPLVNAILRQEPEVSPEESQTVSGDIQEGQIRRSKPLNDLGAASSSMVRTPSALSIPDIQLPPIMEKPSGPAAIDDA